MAWWYGLLPWKRSPPVASPSPSVDTAATPFLLQVENLEERLRRLRGGLATGPAQSRAIQSLSMLGISLEETKEYILIASRAGILQPKQFEEALTSLESNVAKLETQYGPQRAGGVS